MKTGQLLNINFQFAYAFWVNVGDVVYPVNVDLLFCNDGFTFAEEFFITFHCVADTAKWYEFFVVAADVAFVVTKTLLQFFQLCCLVRDNACLFVVCIVTLCNDGVNFVRFGCDTQFFGLQVLFLYLQLFCAYAELRFLDRQVTGHFFVTGAKLGLYTLVFGQQSGTLGLHLGFINNDGGTVCTKGGDCVFFFKKFRVGLFYLSGKTGFFRCQFSAKAVGLTCSLGADAFGLGKCLGRCDVTGLDRGTLCSGTGGFFTDKKEFYLVLARLFA